MESGPGSTARPSPYGRACLNCARTKCKCVLPRIGGSCERCVRLRKECIPAPIVRKKRAKPTSSETARLEQKLDGLVSLLKAGNHNFRGSDIPAASSSSSSTAGLVGDIVNSDNANNAHSNNGTDHCTPLIDNDHSQDPQCPFRPLAPGPAPGPARSSSSLGPYTLAPEVEPSDDEAEHYFHIYRTKHLSLLPFIHFAEDMTSKRLRQERHFLWLCIMAVSSTVISQQNALARAVREMVAREVIVEGDRSMDLLLGMLSFLGWEHYQLENYSPARGPIITLFSHLCITLTLDLELQKDKSKEGNIPHKFVHRMAPSFYAKIRALEPRNLEHRRTALACFLLTSSAASFHSRVESLSWSPYLEQCLKMLEDAKETSGDDLLVQLIKVQRIINQAATVRVQMRDTETEESTRVIGPYISSLKGQLAVIKAQIPSHLATHKVLQMMLPYTEMTITELILVRVHHVPLSVDGDLQTLDCLFTCLRATKSCVDSFLQFEPPEYAGFPFFIWKQFNTLIILLICLISLEDPAWDVTLVQRTVDLPAVLDQIARNLEQLGSLKGWKPDANHQENVFSKAVKMINMMHTWAQSVYNGAAPSAVSDTRVCPIPLDPLPDTTVLPGGEMPMQFPGAHMFSTLDHDPWMADMFGWWPDLSSVGGFGSPGQRPLVP